MSMLGARRGAHLPYQVLAGVIPRPRGWLAATAKLQGITLSPEEPQIFKTFLEILDYKPAFQVITVFAPIGLMDKPTAKGRKCDRDARKVLGWPRSSAVASAPARVALGSSSYEEAVAANGGSLNPVSWRRLPRIQEIDEDIAPYWQRTVFEVHSELSFFQLNGDKPLRLSKHSDAGIDERRAILADRFPGVDRILDARLTGATRSHLTDAAACLWTARRIMARSVTRLPEDPEWDSHGLRMELVR